jgi:hypothetical protein
MVQLENKFSNDSSLGISHQRISKSGDSFITNQPTKLTDFHNLESVHEPSQFSQDSIHQGSVQEKAFVDH